MFCLLSATAGLGILSILFLFALCFVGVHLVLLARLGVLYRQEEEEVQSSERPNEQPKAPEKKEEPAQPPPSNAPPKPIYYIVEKKRKTKASYSAPKQIKFK
jgi:hypothetical protein